MSRTLTTPQGHARRAASKARTASYDAEQSSERKRKLALNRFSYSGGFDGYEGRMILKPDHGASSAERT